MQPNQQLAPDAAPATNGHSNLHELFALTDEQILEIAPEAQDVDSTNAPAAMSGRSAATVAPASLPAGSITNVPAEKRQLETGATQPSVTSQDVEPPPWLSAMMKDPWSGEEAREFWQGIQQARQETASYREVFAKPEDARALKELYPGGVNEARTAVERARVLDDIDRAYFGAAGSSAEQTSATRAQLAQTMMRQDPAAFREMVFAGLRALEVAGNSTTHKSVAQAFRPEAFSSTDAQAASAGQNLTPEGVSYNGAAAASVPGVHPDNARARAGTPPGNASAHEAQVAAYAAFEKSANEDLERTVGAAIGRTLEQALPSTGRADTAPLKGRLAATIRQDVESALKADTGAAVQAQCDEVARKHYAELL